MFSRSPEDMGPGGALGAGSVRKVANCPCRCSCSIRPKTGFLLAICPSGVTDVRRGSTADVRVMVSQSPKFPRPGAQVGSISRDGVVQAVGGRDHPGRGRV